MTYNILFNKYYIDEFYQLSFVKIAKGISYFLQMIETFLVEGIVKGIVGAVHSLGETGAKRQDGQIQTYGMVAFVGLAVLMVIFALTGGTYNEFCIHSFIFSFLPFTRNFDSGVRTKDTGIGD